MKSKKNIDNNDALIPLIPHVDSNSVSETVYENVVVIVENTEPPVVEKKKRGRKKNY